MKLLFIVDNKLGIGGGDYSICKFAEYLAKLGNKVYIFAERKDKYFQQLHEKDIQVKYRGFFPQLFRGAGRIDSIWKGIYDFFVIRKLIKRREIDFIIGYQALPAIRASKLSKRFNIPLVNFVFESQVWLKKQLKRVWEEEYSIPKVKKRWEKYKQSLFDSTIIFAISYITKKEVEKWIKKKVDDVIYPGVGVSVIDKVSSQKKENQIIYIGRLNKCKNIDDAIRALSKIDCSPKFIICGKGEERAYLERFARKFNVKYEFKGEVSDYEKWVEIKKSKFMVFPTSFEGFGMPPAEALSCKIPCICTNIPILQEVYKDKVEYFKEHDIGDLCKKMKFLLKNPSYCKKKGKEGKKYVKNKYSWKKSAQKIERILLTNLK